MRRFSPRFSKAFCISFILFNFWFPGIQVFNVDRQGDGYQRGVANQEKAGNYQGALYAIDFNYSGLTDTSGITDFRADSLKFSKVFPLAAFENSRIILKMDDTSAAGFADDSIRVNWGYQTLCPCFDTNTVEQPAQGERDTCFDVRIALDSMSDAHLGLFTTGSVDSTGVIFRSLKVIDTTNVTGYAVQTRWFVPEFDCFIRFWVEGGTGNEIGSFQKVSFDYKRRQRAKAGW